MLLFSRAYILLLDSHDDVVTPNLGRAEIEVSYLDHVCDLCNFMIFEAYSACCLYRSSVNGLLNGICCYCSLLACLGRKLHAITTIGRILGCDNLVSAL